MKATFFSTIALLTATTLAYNIPREAQGYNIQDIEWAFKGPNGEAFKHSGTIEQARDAYRAKFNGANPPGHGEQTSPETKTLRERQINPNDPIWDDAQITCFDANSKHPMGWTHADAGRIAEGYNYLYDAPGSTPEQPPSLAAHSCGRVSCSYKSAIWWCNDTDEQKTLNTWSDIGNGAAEACFACTLSGTKSKCGGQIFQNSGWNVIVREDNDNC